LVRVGNADTVGKPIREFNPSYIGIKVIETSYLDPNYLFYLFMHLHSSGEFKKHANGSTNRVNIRTETIQNITLKLE